MIRLLYWGDVVIGSGRTTSDCIGAVPDWAAGSVAALRDRLSSTEEVFPCPFAVSANRQRTLRFGFVEDLEDRRTWAPLVDTLGRYLDMARQLGKETAFVVFFRPDGVSRMLDEYNERFWAVLQYLHDHDPSPWPVEIPGDPDTPLWEFSFSGSPTFVVAATPAHELRHSRWSPGLVLTFQPRWVFEGLEASTPRGRTARQVIQKRLRRFDDVDPSPLLSAYGDVEGREWRQYLLPDAENSRWRECPFHANTQSTTDDPERTRP